MPDGHLREMHGGDIEGAAIDADMHLPAHLKPMFSELKVRGTQKIGDHDTYVVVGQRQGKAAHPSVFRPAIRPADSALVRFRRDRAGTPSHEIDYADYRDASGVKIPYIAGRSPVPLASSPFRSAM